MGELVANDARLYAKHRRSWLRLANEVLVVAGLRQEVSVDHSIELLDNGPRRRCSVRAQRFSHTVVILAERVRRGNAARR